MLSINIERGADVTVVRAAGELRSHEDSDALVDALALVPFADDLIVDVSALATLPEPCARRLRSRIAARAAGVEVEIVVDDEDVARRLRSPSSSPRRWTVTMVAERDACRMTGVSESMRPA